MAERTHTPHYLINYIMYKIIMHSRQTTGATVAVYNSIVDETWMFMKEISSDGDVSTVNVQRRLEAFM